MLTTAREAFRLVEPVVDRFDYVQARRDPVREESTQERVTVDRLRAAVGRRGRGAPRLLVVVVLRLLEVVVLVRLPAAFLEVPATPWVILRCAPSEAPRVNVFPHSGQVRASGAGVVVALVARVAIGCSFPSGTGLDCSQC